MQPAHIPGPGMNQIYSLEWLSRQGAGGEVPHTMRFGSTAKVLAECKLKY